VTFSPSARTCPKNSKTPVLGFFLSVPVGRAACNFDMMIKLCPAKPEKRGQPFGSPRLPPNLA
jgi:hypothetical protein